MNVLRLYLRWLGFPEGNRIYLVYRTLLKLDDLAWLCLVKVGKTVSGVCQTLIVANREHMTPTRCKKASVATKSRHKKGERPDSIPYICGIK